MSYSIPTFTCSCEPYGTKTALVSVSGELDLATSPRLLVALQEAQHGSGSVILDLRGVSFMDCSGLHAILDAKATHDAEDCRLLIVRGQPHVHKLFELSETSRCLEIVELGRAQSATEALPQFAGTGIAEPLVQRREATDSQVLGR